MHSSSLVCRLLFSSLTLFDLVTGRPHEVLRVVLVDHVLIIFFFTIIGDNDFLSVGGSLLLGGNELTLSEVIDVDVAVRLPIDDLIGVVCDASDLLVQTRQLVDLVLNECV